MMARANTTDRRFVRWPRRTERGAVLPLAVVGVVLAMVAASLAVDLGSLAQDARQDQKVADLAALDAVRALPGPADQTDQLSVTKAAQNSAGRNDAHWSEPGHTLAVEWSDITTGLFSTDTTKLPVANAVRVTVTSPHRNAFPFVGGPASMTRKAVATLGNNKGCTLPDICLGVDGTPIGTVRVGSALASVTTENVILNKLLTQTMGGSYNLDAVGWQGIAAGNVTFKRLRTALGYSAGSADSALDATFTFRQLLDATVTALNADGSPSSVTAATKLATIASQVAANAGATMTLRQLFDVTGNVGSGKDVADAAINVKDIVVGGMALGDADHFASMNLTAANIPGLPGTSVDVRFGLIEAPQTRSGPPKDGSGYRTVAHTAQIRLVVTQHLDVSVAGIGVLNVSVPYYLEIGRATAKLDTITCTAGQAVPTDVSILGSTDAGKTEVAAVGDAALSNPATPPVPGVATLVNVLGITMTTTSVAAATVTIPGNAGTLLHFSPPYTSGGASQHISATTLSLPTLTTSNTTTAGGGLLNGLVSTTVLNAVNLVVPSLTTSLISPLMKGLGLSYAGADVWAPPPQNCNPTSFNTDPPPGTVIALPSLVS
jgi:uncharacterized membrane protein